MIETCSILFAGLSASDMTLASGHLSRSGHQVVVAANAAEAQEKLNAQKVDLLYLQVPSDGTAVKKLDEIVSVLMEVETLDRQAFEELMGEGLANRETVPTYGDG